MQPMQQAQQPVVLAPRVYHEYHPGPDHHDALRRERQHDTPSYKHVWKKLLVRWIPRHWRVLT